MSKEELVSKWIKRISKAEQTYQPYHDLVDTIRKYYKNESQNKSSIFWSSIETLKPFLYFKQPKPYVERKDKNANPTQMLACKILEKALAWDLEQFDFDGVVKYARNDYLLSGCGLLYEKYCPTFKQVVVEDVAVDENGNQVVTQTTAEILDSEQVNTIYIDPKDFIVDSEKVGIWEDVTWVARKISMTSQEVFNQFGEIAKQLAPAENLEDPSKKVVVYQIFDKAKKQILYLSKDYKQDFLKITDDPFKLDGFFPMPKPILTTTTNDSLIPVPDYSEIKGMLEELDGITSRMKLIMQALKVSGCYDSSMPELAGLLNKEMTLVSVADFSKLKQNGGLAGVVDFMPIAQYVDTLQALAQRKQEVLNDIYEVTGVSDIMRGNSDPNETATAVTKKTNFGTLRNQDRQNDMQKFLIDLLRIKADIICERFNEETLSRFADSDDKQAVMEAIQLLKTERAREMVLGIDTDTAFDQEGILDKVTNAVTTINEMVSKSFEVISAQPLLLPLYRQMVESVVATMPNARQFEPVIEKVFDDIQNELAQPQEEQPNIELEKVKVEREKMQLQAMEAQATNAIKEKQLQLDLAKLQQESGKAYDDTFLKNKEIETQAQLKTAELIQKGNTDTNIGAGMVRSFE